MSRSTQLWVVAVSLAVTACAVPEAPSNPEPTAPRAPITASGVMARLRALPAPRPSGSPGMVAARAQVFTELADLGLAPTRRAFTWAGLPGVELVNIEARLAGPAAGATPPEGPLLLLCAHLDTVPGSPGADDNGSGVVALLEVARRLAGRDLPGEVRLLLVDGEEGGLAGSRQYVRELDPGTRDRIAGVINLESVGYADRQSGSQAMPAFTEALLDPGPVGDFVLVLANQASAELARHVSSALDAGRGDLRVVTYERLAGLGWLVPDSRRSDHASFWDAGIPAVMLTDTAPFRNPHYHRASDTPDTLDGPFLAAVARGLERAALTWAGAVGE